MSKKILIVTDNLKDQINGVVTTFKNIEKRAVLDGYSFLYLDPGKFVHFNCPGYSEVKLSIPWKIGEKIKKMAPDYIHIATEGPIGVGCRLYLNKHNINYNTSYHTKFPEFVNKLYGIPTSLSYKYLKWFHNNSKVVLTTSKTMTDELKLKGFGNKFIEWSRGVEVEGNSFEYNHEPSNNVLYVGRISKEKNLEALLCLQNYYNITIVGDGPERKNLEKKYPKANFVGYKQGYELFDYYKKADVFCFPSLLDTFGVVIIEAMSQGTPVAAFNVTGPKDIVKQGVTGYLGDDLNNSIQKCMALDRKTIYEHSKAWTWEKSWITFKNNLTPCTELVDLIFRSRHNKKTI